MEDLLRRVSHYAREASNNPYQKRYSKEICFEINEFRLMPSKLELLHALRDFAKQKALRPSAVSRKARLSPKTTRSWFPMAIQHENLAVVTD